jgi:hypothetical protein
MQLKPTTILKITLVFLLEDLGRFLTLIRHQVLSGSPIQITFSEEITPVVVKDMDSGLILKLTQLDLLMIQMFALSTKNLENLATMLLTQMEDMDLEFSIT